MICSCYWMFQVKSNIADHSSDVGISVLSRRPCLLSYIVADVLKEKSFRLLTGFLFISIGVISYVTSIPSV